jgi:hypothetical protein
MVQADTSRKKLRACTSNSSSVVLSNADVIGAALPSRHWPNLRTNHGEGGASAPHRDGDLGAAGVPDAEGEVCWIACLCGPVSM